MRTFVTAPRLRNWIPLAKPGMPNSRARRSDGHSELASMGICSHSSRKRAHACVELGNEIVLLLRYYSCYPVRSHVILY